MLLREQVTKQPDEQLKERLVLTYAEALVRAGEYRDPYYPPATNHAAIS